MTTHKNKSKPKLEKSFVNNETYKIGIDLSLNSCGIAILNPSNRLIKGSTHKFVHRKMNLLTQLECRKIVIDALEKQRGALSLYIEIGNYGNPLMTQKFGIMGGMIMSSFVEQISQTKKIWLSDIKLVSPNDWFRLLVQDKQIETSWSSLTREQRKQISMQYSAIKQDDISDAYWIAYYGHLTEGAF